MELRKLYDRLHALVSIHDGLDVEAARLTMRKNIKFKGMNVWILACAIVIASIGLNVNSVAVIIGAMLISPLMGPIIGFGLALGTNDIQLMKSSLGNLATMVIISITASALFFLLSPLNLMYQSELLARTNPTIYDVLVAFFGGMAGALEASRRDKGTVISGVAIATALMPPLCTVGYGLSVLDFHYISGALYLFAINCIFVALATFLVVKYLRFPKYAEPDEKKSARVKTLATVILIAMIVPSVLSAIKVVKENDFNIRASRFVETHKTIDGVLVYDYSTDPSGSDPVICIQTAGRPLTMEEKMLLQSEARQMCRNENTRLEFNESSLIGLDDNSEFEKQVYSDLNAQLQAMRDSVSVYKSLQLPYKQIESEMYALFPQVDTFQLARGEKGVIALITYKPEKSESLSSQIESWLRIRLSTEEVKVYEF